MAQALELYFGLPLAWGYLLSSIIIIPLVFYGITLINKLQMWTQPIWLIMMISPFIAVLFKEPDAIKVFVNFTGTVSTSSEFNLYHFGFAIGISFSLIAQIGEQVDYIRFMPPLKEDNKIKWWTSMLIAGPGWIILGFLKQIGGIFLASIVLLSGLSLYEAKTPIQMYFIAYEYIFDNSEVALAAATFFIVVSQVKINVTNAYAGSLAWSNFFSRITHSHPGRVVWMVFNISIALLLMELGLFDVLQKVLGLYSNVAIAWIGAITADLVINKPLGLSPKIIEFKRAYLFNINPVGVGSMGIASVVSIVSFMGAFGDIAQSYSSLIAMFLAFVLAPLIAYLTKGKYYIARTNELVKEDVKVHTCEVCENEYEKEDMAFCPVHNVKICSLCCSLDSLCHDGCKKESKKTLRVQFGRYLKVFSFDKLSTRASLRLFDFFMYSFIVLFIVAVVIWMVFSMQVDKFDASNVYYLQESFITMFLIISVLLCTLVWWALLMQESRELAENELSQQYIALQETKNIIDYQAHHDSLTQLPNRTLFNDRLGYIIKKAKKDNTQFALFFINLDKFKNINDTFGHLIGDKVLKKTTLRLLDIVENKDNIARLSGDEFALIMEKTDADNYASIVANKILKSLSNTMNIESHEIKISSSVGISLFPKDDKLEDKLVMYADLAMYEAKAQGRDMFKFYSKEMTKLVVKNIGMETSLRNAIINEEFIVYYQPQIDVKTEKIVGMEALIRWDNPITGFLEPEVFIEVAKETDLIIDIEKQIIRDSMQDFMHWHTYDLKPEKLALNISINGLNSEDFIEYLRSLMKKIGFKADWLELEISETQLMQNPKDIIIILEQISKMGIRLSISDFGISNASIAYLKTLSIDSLKIDKSFVKELSSKEDEIFVAKAIIDLSKNLRLQVTADGVDTQEQKDILEEYGCINMQGEFYAQAVSANEMKDYLIKGLVKR